MLPQQNGQRLLPFVGLHVAAVLAGWSISVGDIDQDGVPDVLLADDDGRIWQVIPLAIVFPVASFALPC